MMFNQRLGYWLAAGLCFFCTTIAFNGIEYHATTAIIDDLSITYAYVMKYPDFFQKDVMSIAGQAPIYGSIINWGSGLLWIAGIEPRVSYIGLVLLQSMLIGISGYLLTLAITRNTILALLATLFLYAVQPWQWNITQFGTLFPVMYGQQLAVALSMLAFFALLRRREVLALGLTLLAGWVHPVVGISSTMMMGLYWLLDLRNNPAQFKFLFGAALVGVLTLIPSQLALLQVKEPLPADVVIERMQSNFHLSPFDGRFNNPSVETFLEWAALVIASLPIWKSLDVLARKLVVASALGTLLLTLSHFFSLQINFTSGILFAGARSNLVFAVATVPVVLAYSATFFEKRNVIGITASLLLAYALLIDSLALMRLLILVYFLLGLADGFFLIWPIRIKPAVRYVLLALAAGALILWTADLLSEKALASELQSHMEAIPAALQDAGSRIVIYALAAAIALAVIPRILTRLHQQRLTRYANIIGVGIIFASFMSLTADRLQAGYVNIFMSADWVHDLYEAQVWARDNTPQDAMFVGPEISWRAGAERPYLYLYPRAWYLYFLDQRLYDQREDMMSWLGVTDETFFLYDLTLVYQMLNSQDFLELREVEQVDYALRGVGERLPDGLPEHLGFEEVYQNDTLSIYDLNHPISDLISDLDLAVQEQWSGAPQSGGGYMLDASGGLNSLRPYLILNYIPGARRDAEFANSYAVAEKEYLDGIWSVETPAPLLRDLQIEYVYIDEQWWNTTTDKARAAIEDPDQFTELFRVEDGDAMRGLYHVNDVELTGYPPDMLPRDPLEIAVVTRLYDGWPFAPDTQETILLPRDNRGLNLSTHFVGVVLPEELPASAAEAIDNWQNTKLSNYLTEAKVDYLFYDHVWWGFLTDAERETLSDDANYRIVREWRFGPGEFDPFFRLVEVVTEPDTEQ